MNDELKAYVESCLSQGYSKEKLIKALRDYGYDDKTILDTLTIVDANKNPYLTKEDTEEYEEIIKHDSEEVKDDEEKLDSVLHLTNVLLVLLGLTLLGLLVYQFI